MNKKTTENYDDTSRQATVFWTSVFMAYHESINNTASNVKELCAFMFNGDLQELQHFEACRWKWSFWPMFRCGVDIRNCTRIVA